MGKVLGIIVFLALSGLVACTNFEKTVYTTYPGYAYDQPYYFSQNYESVDYSDPSMQKTSTPGFYPDATYPRPRSHKSQDQNWVIGQNPQGYTIEIANSEKASQVANKLYKTPKTDRTAEVKYYANGQKYYKGVYGSFSSYAEAQKALNALPPDIKNGSGITSWGEVQKNLED